MTNPTTKSVQMINVPQLISVSIFIFMSVDGCAQNFLHFPSFSVSSRILGAVSVATPLDSQPPSHPSQKFFCQFPCFFPRVVFPLFSFFFFVTLRFDEFLDLFSFILWIFHSKKQKKEALCFPSR